MEDINVVVTSSGVSLKEVLTKEVEETSWTYEKIFKCFTFMDGKPFGVRY